ncbi:MAG: hypothetical protein ACLQLO_31935 [Mycobacterium sp.]
MSRVSRNVLSAGDFGVFTPPVSAASRETADRPEQQPPPELLAFPGPGQVYTSAVEWERDFWQWHEARQRWAAARGLEAADLLSTIGDSPWDPELI